MYAISLQQIRECEKKNLQKLSINFIFSDVWCVPCSSGVERQSGVTSSKCTGSQTPPSTFTFRSFLISWKTIRPVSKRTVLDFFLHNTVCLWDRDIFFEGYITLLMDRHLHETYIESSPIPKEILFSSSSKASYKRGEVYTADIF